MARRIGSGIQVAHKSASPSAAPELTNALLTQSSLRATIVAYGRLGKLPDVQQSEPSMKEKQRGQPHAQDPDNVEFIRLVAELSGHGLSQYDLAGLLNISPGQLSRVKSGERRAAWKHVRTLRNHLKQLAGEQRSKEILTTNRLPAISVDRHVLNRLTFISAVEAFRDLLWA